MSKRVGIMTLYYKTYNYGAQMQAYALQKAVSSLGYNCELIKFQWCGYKTISSYENMGRNVEKFQAFSMSIPHSRKLFKPENVHECADTYDAFVCGSDQIWGCADSMPIHVLPLMTLAFVSENKLKIAYAASMGGAAVTNRISDAIAPSAGRLDAISVREQSSVAFVSDLVGKDVVRTLDPTLLLSRDEWAKISIKPESKEKYLFVYTVGNSEAVDKAIRVLQERTGYRVISLSYSQEDNAGPHEFLGLIQNAEYVLTNSFHGTIFSIIFQKRFLSFCVDRDSTEFSKNIRITDLLHLLNLDNRFVSDETTVTDSLLRETINYETVDRILQIERENSLAFLSNSLRINNKSIVEDSNKTGRAYSPIQPQAYYLKNIALNSTAEKLFYENKLIEQYMESERRLFGLYYDRRREALIARLTKFMYMGLSLDNFPELQGQIILYGAGQAGRMIFNCFERNVVCFVDRSENCTICCGVPVYKLMSDKLCDIVQSREITTFIVTPVTEPETIMDEILQLYPQVNVITAESVVSGLCL